MSKHYKPLLSLLKERGSQGAYNHELQLIAHRFGARLKELRKGLHDGVNHRITCKYVSKGVYKYTLIPQEDFKTNEVISLLTPETTGPKVTKEEAKAKWEQARSLFKRQRQVETEAQMYKRKIEEMEQKLNQPLSPEEKYNTQYLLDHYQSTYKMYEHQI